MGLIKIKQVEGLTDSIDFLEGSVDSLESQVQAGTGELENSVDSLESEISSDVSSLDTRASGIEDDLSTEISTTDSEVSSLDTRASGIEDDLSTEISTTDSEVSSLDTRATDIESSVDSLENVLVEDDEFFVEVFNNVTATASSPFDVTVTSGSVQDSRAALVWAFINGVRTDVSGVNDQTITLLADFDVDTNDEIVIQYQAE